jgi:CheY-like chemotaxis protein
MNLEEKMIKALMVCADRNSLADFASALEKSDELDVSWAESGSSALEVVSGSAFDLAVIDDTLEDMTGIEFAENLVKQNPMINCAAVSRLSSEDFHEETEGLGLLMQLPPAPGEAEADKLLGHLKQILGMM